MEVISWNSCRKSWKRKRRKLTKKLSELNSDLLVLLQEVKSWKDDIVGNFRVLSEEGKDCAVLVPNAWAHSIASVVHGQYYSLAILGKLAVGSIHFPHDQGDADVWLETFEGVEIN